MAPVSGSQVYGRDMPPAQYDQDWTTIPNIPSTSYTAGTPEVGVNFTAPTSGRVLVCLGAGMRNNAATSERAVVTFQMFENSSDGVSVVSAAFTNGIVSCGTASSQDFKYTGGFKMVSDLTPGVNYYARVVHRSTNAASTADIASRDITVIPLT